MHSEGAAERSKLNRLPLKSAVRYARRYAFSLVKNGIKVMLGRSPFFHDEDLFFRQYLLQVLGLRPIRQINCPGLHSEGAGSQAVMLLDAINFCRCCGLTYVHTPFSQIAHSDGRPSAEWNAVWEKHFNLGAGEIPWTGNRHEVVSYCSNRQSLHHVFGWPAFEEEFRRSFQAMIPEIRRKYYLNKTPRRNAELVVAVHIRRGDVSSARKEHFTSSESILRTVQQVEAVLHSRGLCHSIAVYSEGSPRDFEEFAQTGAQLWISADPVWTMSEMIEADILIMAKGYFSYYAGLVCDGIKIFDGEQPPAEDFIVRALDGSFDGAVFERQLDHLLEIRAHILSGFADKTDK